ncbi:MAG: VIT1/CCC1 transporter family protein [Candidatus Diapherotrites archaeon]
MEGKLGEGMKKRLLEAQKNEITEHLIYKRLSWATKDKPNSEVLEAISKDELKHYNQWKALTGENVRPDALKLSWFVWVSRIFGLTFGVKLMEKGEEGAQKNYSEIAKTIPEAKAILDDEDRHEKELVAMINEERLQYVGSIVLGINDALVELTGALAGFTLALQNSAIIAMVGLITGIAAALSMGASEYLSTKTEKNVKNPKKAAIYTGSVYMVTVLLLVLPFFVFSEVLVSLFFTLCVAVAVIFIFTFYVSVAQDINFRERFLEMALISLGVAAISFGIGFLVRIFLNIDV